MSVLPKIAGPGAIAVDAKDLSRLSVSEIQSAINRDWGSGMKVKSASFSRLEGGGGSEAVYKITYDDPSNHEKNVTTTLYVEYSGGRLSTQFGT